MQNWKTRTQEEENDDGSVVQYWTHLNSIGFSVDLCASGGDILFSWPSTLRSTIPADAVQEKENTDEQPERILYFCLSITEKRM